MGADAIEAKPTEFRARQVIALVCAVLFAGLALIPYPGVGYLEAWPIRLMVLPPVIPFLFIARGLRARAAVTQASAGPMYLLFVPALDERVTEINLVPFDSKAVQASLERHGWM